MGIQFCFKHLERKETGFDAVLVKILINGIIIYSTQAISDIKHSHTNCIIIKVHLYIILASFT